MSSKTATAVVRLTDGVWAVRDEGGVWVGVLDGDIDRGWRSHVERIHLADEAAVVRALNLGHAFDGDRIIVRVDRRGTTVSLAGGHHALLDVSASVRLQILCTPRPVPAPTTEPAPTLPVGSARGGLRVYDTPVLGDGVRVSGVAARHSGTVMLDLLSDRGLFRLPLPALPLLLAGAEATCDDRPVTLRLVDRSGHVTVVRAAADVCQQAAADAQWLIPALVRKLEDDAWTRYA